MVLNRGNTQGFIANGPKPVRVEKLIDKTDDRVEADSIGTYSSRLYSS